VSAAATEYVIAETAIE